MASVAATVGARLAATTATRVAATTAGRVGSQVGSRAITTSSRTIFSTGRSNPLSSTATRTVATNPNAANFTTRTGFLTRNFNQTFRGTSTVPTRTPVSNAPSAFSQTSRNPLSSGATQGANRTSTSTTTSFSRSSKNPLTSGASNTATKAPKTWAGRASSLAKGTGTYVLPNLVGLAPLLLMNQNPLKGLENLLNPANWVQDLSWLGSLLDPSKWQQDFTWVERMMSNLGGDIGSAVGGLERFAEGAWKDAETVGSDAVWGVEEIVKYAPYLGMFIAVLWVIQSFNGK